MKRRKFLQSLGIGAAAVTVVPKLVEALPNPRPLNKTNH